MTNNLINTTQHYNITILADSDVKTGALNKSVDGSVFTISFSAPLKIPKEATNCNVICKNATVWFTTPNISNTFNNNQFRIKYGLNPWLQITIPDGLYDVTNLSQKLAIELNNADPNYPIDLFELLPDYSENKVILKINYYDVLIDLTIINSIKDIIGYESQLITGPVGIEPLPTYFKEQKNIIARFNTTDYYLIKCNTLLSRGIERNGDYSGILAKIDVDVGVNKKIIYDPRQTITIPAPELPGIDLSAIEFTLLNQNNIRVDTKGENWTVTFEIHYDLVIPVRDKPNLIDLYHEEKGQQTYRF